MDKIAFILGAGAHRPFSFPLGEALKTEIAQELENLGSRPSESREDYIAARSAIQHCGVSIDRFLSENNRWNSLVRPLIAKCLLLHERNATDRAICDWIGYLWSSFTTPGVPKQLSDRFVFITFNYDRTIEWFIANACSSLWGMPLIDACNFVEERLSIYHVYGSFGCIGTAGKRCIPYGDVDQFASAGQALKIIGEHEDTTTDDIHSRLKDVTHVFIMGCAYHTENMSLLSLDKLDLMPQVHGTTLGLSAAERDRMKRRYPFMNWAGHLEGDCLHMIKVGDSFQRLLD